MTTAHLEDITSEPASLYNDGLLADGETAPVCPGDNDVASECAHFGPDKPADLLTDSVATLIQPEDKDAESEFARFCRDEFVGLLAESAQINETSAAPRPPTTPARLKRISGLKRLLENSLTASRNPTQGPSTFSWQVAADSPVNDTSLPSRQSFESKTSYFTASSSSTYFSAQSSTSMSRLNLPSATIETPFTSLTRTLGLVAEDPLEEVDWSGKGRHVEYKYFEGVPLQAISVLGYSATALVEKVKCRRIMLARKLITLSRKMSPKDVMSEVKHLQKLHHPHVIQLVGTYLKGKKLAILLYPVAEYNLSAYLEEIELMREKPREEAVHLPSGLVVSVRERDIHMNGVLRSLDRFFGCLISVVEYIHSQEIKHMDIKPQNILVRNRNGLDSVYLADFGLSHDYSDQTSSQNAHIIARSPVYCAPEVYKQDLWGRAADVFSLGCVFAEMITVLGGRTRDEFAEFRRCDNDRYHDNLPKVCEWLSSITVPDVFSTSQKTSLVIAMLTEAPSNRRSIQDAKIDIIGSLHNRCCSVGIETYEAADIEERRVEVANRDEQRWKAIPYSTRI